MRKKYLKLITGCLLLTSSLPLSSCGTTQKKDEEEVKPDPGPTPTPTPTPAVLESIKIISEFPSLKINVDEIYDSGTIEVKCYDTNKNEMESKYSLALTSLKPETLNISISNNRIHIEGGNKVGIYQYQIIAVSADGLIASNSKTINIEIYDDSIIPDSFEIAGQDNIELYFPTSSTFDYELIAKKEGKIITGFEDEVNVSLTLTSSSTSLVVDKFNNPIFNFIKDKNKIIVSLSKNLDFTYQGKYTVDLKIELSSNPTVSSIKTITFNLTNGVSYYDHDTKYFYSRPNIDSDWELKSVNCETKVLEKSKIKSEIYSKPVTKIANSFCNISGISKLVVAETSPNIKIIGDYAFADQPPLAQAWITGVSHVGDYAFQNCGVVGVETTKEFSLISIGKYAFSECHRLNMRYCPHIEYIGESAFVATKITEIHLGKNLKYLGANCFKNCSELQNIYISATTPPELMGEIIGGSTPTDCKIHVPMYALENYLSHPN